MVEADPTSITRAPLSRRAELKQTASAVAAIGAIAPDATPADILVPACDGDAPVVPARWAGLRKHLTRVHASAPDLEARLDEARQAWKEHQAALARPLVPAWYTAAEAAEDQERRRASRRCTSVSP